MTVGGGSGLARVAGIGSLLAGDSFGGGLSFVLTCGSGLLAQGEISAGIMPADNGAAYCRVFLVGGFVVVLIYLQVRECRVIRETV